MGIVKGGFKSVKKLYISYINLIVEVFIFFSETEEPGCLPRNGSESGLFLEIPLIKSLVFLIK